MSVIVQIKTTKNDREVILCVVMHTVNQKKNASLFRIMLFLFVANELSCYCSVDLNGHLRLFFRCSTFRDFLTITQTLQYGTPIAAA